MKQPSAKIFRVNYNISCIFELFRAILTILYLTLTVNWFKVSESTKRFKCICPLNAACTLYSLDVCRYFVKNKVCSPEELLKRPPSRTLRRPSRATARIHLTTFRQAKKVKLNLSDRTVCTFYQEIQVKLLIFSSGVVHS